MKYKLIWGQSHNRDECRERIFYDESKAREYFKNTFNILQHLVISGHITEMTCLLETIRTRKEWEDYGKERDCKNYARRKGQRHTQNK